MQEAESQTCDRQLNATGAVPSQPRNCRAKFDSAKLPSIPISSTASKINQTCPALKRAANSPANVSGTTNSPVANRNHSPNKYASKPCPCKSAKDTHTGNFPASNNPQAIDDQYQTIARPLTKFFNLSEYPSSLPNGTPEIYEKLDGSMILLFFYADRWQIASRGSFASEQADKARDLLHNYQDDLANLDRTHTYMLEVIYPQNWIVVDYGAAERLVMLAGIHSFILKWPNGFRVKYKLEEYVRLHRVLTRIQAKDIWECMSHQQPLDEYLEMVPDEFYQWVKKVQKDLLAEYAAIETTAKSLFKPLADFGSDRKAAAAYISGQSHRTILFLMLDDRDYSEVIWRQIKPDFQLPFRNEA